MLTPAPSRRGPYSLRGLAIPHRKSIRFFFIPSIIIAVLLLSYLAPHGVLPDDCEGLSPLSALLGCRQLLKRMGTTGPGGESNPFEEFRKGWPKLRGHEARGKSVMRSKAPGMTFDWYSVRKLFVL